MLNPLVDTRDVKFVLFELLEAQKMTEYSAFADFDLDTFEATIDLAEQMAVEVFYPTAEEGDKIGAKWDPVTKEVKIPEIFKPALDKFYEAGFMGLTDSPEHGGTGMPNMVGAAVNEYVCAANYSLGMYPGLSHGAMELIYAFGTEEQKKLYADKIMTGEWGGTMCLTEPDAGSDVGNLKTKAVKQPDGTYKIQGQKIFISSGENDYYKNMIHPVLARIEGDPKGTKGISIFIVPKYRVNPDGSLGEFNDVVCTGIEHKMGIHGQGTSQLAFGDNGNCIGYLLGEERQGMKIMFKMMNYARNGVAVQGQGNASAAYMHAVTYAKNRYQGSDVTQMLNPDAPLVTISKHPDVKRMLLWMKSHLEGQRILCYYLYKNIDLANIAPDETARKEAQALVEILTPICKAGCTDKGVEITSMAMQTYGGYGYCRDYPIVRYMCDSKILAIWEGTNGIQSMDLTMRKILMNKDQYNYKVMRKRMDDTIAAAKGIVEDKYIEIFVDGLKELDEIIEMFKKHMAEGKFLHLFMHATPLQEAMYMVAIAWCHLWSLTKTLPKMKELVGDTKGADRDKLLAENDEAAFYTGKVLASQFYIGSEFPKFFGRAKAIKWNETATIKATDPVFTGAPLE
ncbi:MAG TPA: acyl-CoA dehydrogenase [Spirochaetota bacterium]|nr:acyl-CoA dehydrogenase [Spirochaetota bacterium]HRU65339.1 acyl-CoA dehydrogenase [Spirochaetota bacterium]